MIWKEVAFGIQQCLWINTIKDWRGMLIPRTCWSIQPNGLRWPSINRGLNFHSHLSYNPVIKLGYKPQAAQFGELYPKMKQEHLINLSTLATHDTEAGNKYSASF